METLIKKSQPLKWINKIDSLIIMYMNLLAVILMISALLKAQSPVLGSYRRKPSEICSDAIQNLDCEFTPVLLESTIVTCDIQVVNGLNYKILLTNNTFTSDDCYLYLFKRNNGLISIRDNESLERNCLDALNKNTTSSTPKPYVENIPLEPQPLEPSPTTTDPVVPSQPIEDQTSVGNSSTHDNSSGVTEPLTESAKVPADTLQA